MTATAARLPCNYIQHVERESQELQYRYYYYCILLFYSLSLNGSTFTPISHSVPDTSGLFDMFSVTQFHRLLSQFTAVRPTKQLLVGISPRSVRRPNLDSYTSCCVSYVRLEPVARVEYRISAVSSCYSANTTASAFTTERPHVWSAQMHLRNSQKIIFATVFV